MADGPDRRTGRRAPEEYRDFAILQLAAREFRQRGFHGTSMQQLAAAAGIQKGSLYHHFTGKEEILFRIIERAVRIMLEPLRRIVQRDQPADIQLHAALRNHILSICEQPDELGVLLFEARSLTEPLRRQAGRTRREYEEHFIGIIRRGVDAGLFWEQDPKLATYALFGMSNWIVQWYDRNGSLTPDELADYFVRLGVAAVAGRLPAERPAPGPGVAG